MATGIEFSFDGDCDPGIAVPSSRAPPISHSDLTPEMPDHTPSVSKGIDGKGPRIVKILLRARCD